MKQYIKQIDNQNFVYPNNFFAEYDLEIIHNINDNSVTGTINSFSAISSSGNVLINLNFTWNKNGAEPFIPPSNQLNVVSVHMTQPTVNYMKPWSCVGYYYSSSLSSTTITDTLTISASPSQFGLSSFSTGVYQFEIRFLGKKGVYPICTGTTITF